MGIKVTFLREPDQAAGRGPAPAAQPVTLVPKASIATDAGGSFVFIVRGDAVERRAVKTAGADGDRVEVIAGLQPGDRVVLTPPKELTNGAKVAVK
jgi:hypothetical protein